MSNCSYFVQKTLLDGICAKNLAGWQEGWKEGWMDGGKSRVKDCLQQSKIRSIFQMGLVADILILGINYNTLHKILMEIIAKLHHKHLGTFMT